MVPFAFPDEAPIHPVTVQTFCLDRTEVTVAALRSFAETAAGSFSSSSDDASALRAAAGISAQAA